MRIFLFLSMGFLSFTLGGQQLAQYSLNLMDKYRITPAYGGMDASLSLIGAVRTQWLDFPRQPKSQSISAHLPVYIFNGGAGIQFSNEKLGVERNLKVNASYNYVMETDYGLFSIGLGAGIVQKTLDYNEIRTPGGVYEGSLVDHRDPVLNGDVGSAIAPSLRLGIYFDNGLWEAGLGIDNLIESKAKFDENLSVDLKRVFQGFVEYTYEYDESLSIFPSVYAKSDFIQTQIELSARVEYQQQFFGGLSFRGYSNETIDAIVVYLGMFVNPKLTVAYAYDASLSGIKNFQDGTHELVLAYNLGKPIGLGRPEPIIYNPRF